MNIRKVYEFLDWERTFYLQSVALRVAQLRAEETGHRHAVWYLGPDPGATGEAWGVFRLRERLDG